MLAAALLRYEVLDDTEIDRILAGESLDRSEKTDTATARDSHHFACLIGFGASCDPATERTGGALGLQR